MSIKWAGVAVAALLGAGGANAEEVAIPIDLPTTAVIKLTLEKSKETLQDGRPTQSAVITQVYDVRVEPASDDAHRVTWTLKEARETGSGQDISAALPREPMIFLADDTLAPLAFENWDAVRDATLRVVQTQAGGQAQAGMKAMYDGLTPEAAAQMFLQDAALLSIGQNTMLNVGELVEYQEEVGNPLGGPPITSNASFRLESADRSKGRAVVVWKSALDPESTTASLKVMAPALLARMGAPADVDVSTVAAQIKVERTDQCRFDIDMKTGLAAAADCERRTVLGMPGQGAQTRVERTKATQTLQR